MDGAGLRTKKRSGSLAPHTAFNQQNQSGVNSGGICFCSPAVRRNCPMIVGLAVSREEAFELVEAIALETYRETGEVKIREWLLNRIEGCE